MGNITFSQRYRENNAFRQAIEDLKNEVILEALGLDTEMVNGAWDGKNLNVALIHEGKTKLRLAVASKEKSRAERELEKIKGFLRESLADRLVPGTTFENIVHLLTPGEGVADAPKGDVSGDKEQAEAEVEAVAEE